MLIVYRNKKEPNKALQTRYMLVTRRAAHATRQACICLILAFGKKIKIGSRRHSPSLWPADGASVERSLIPSLETHFFNHRVTVFLAQVPINAHGQSASVLMAKPSAHRRDVHARLNAGRGEEVPEIVMGKSWIAQTTASGANAFLGAVDLAHPVGRLALGFSGVSNAEQMGAQGICERDDAVFAIFCACLAACHRE